MQAASWPRRRWRSGTLAFRSVHFRAAGTLVGSSPAAVVQAGACDVPADWRPSYDLIFDNCRARGFPPHLHRGARWRRLEPPHRSWVGDSPVRSGLLRHDWTTVTLLQRRPILTNQVVAHTSP